MISETDDQRQASDDRATVVWSLLVSGFINLMVWMLAAWGVALRLHAMMAAPEHHPQETFMVASSSIHIAPHSHPVPQTQPVPVRQQRAQPPPKALPRRVVKQPEAQPTEIARIEPTAPPQPRSAPKKVRQGTLAEQLAQQEVAFQHEAQQLNAQQAPLSIATIDPNQRAAATRSYHMNFSGTTELQGHGEGFLIPLRAWGENGMHCYYGQYHWLYPTGGTEVANIPWAFCFPPNDDPIARGIREFPFPLPLPGYRVPAGTYLYPIEKEVYDFWLAHQ
ncbi:MAG TPA: hypothetical protein VMF11_14460 [Candidatus Baltobacteraceae bacterium]|nr:hypothetical protein [Candidatus Baltobacteraceae bacterium]